MKHNDLYDSTEQVHHGAAWHLDGLYAVNGDTNNRVYVRALVDIGSYEFNVCKLSNRQRLDIISIIGEPEIFRLIKVIFIAKGYEYRDEHFRLDMALLRKSVDPVLNLSVLLRESANKTEVETRDVEK